MREDERRMTAARYYGPGSLRIEEAPVPEPEADQVLIRLELCGICGTDVHEYVEGPIFSPTEARPDPLTGERPPVGFGHEFVGRVVARGESATRIPLGARVAVEPRRTCGECEACRGGYRNCCPSAATIGLQGGGGGIAEFIAVDERLAFDVGGIPARTAVAIEPIAVAVHAVSRAGVPIEGETALVAGAGPIGALVAWVLRAMGAAEVVVVEPGARRREAARRFGATRTIDPGGTDVRAQLTAWGIAPRLAFDCAGHAATLQTCIEAVRPRGVVVNVAISARPAEVHFLPVTTKEVTLLGTICYADDHPTAIRLLQERDFPTDDFLTAVYPMERTVEAIETLRTRAGDHMKIAIDVGGAG
ncbi:alcohol dehydrogenase catalytic domain-containing protein [Gulosibacter sp. 10]|uniref:zinc-binding dehydrogenase n=1 Tax=Gulosibacter sp. 10 TaxID=1255570 RepID=UPI00097E7D1B|nr:alcohol dehydrogenase catalytic domain-containing protein [Gulosibacter sp. 10]SJM70925.1 2,3-butanediol dehydrogenase, R-alcohol forming, (R)-and (S)-acetoin-specific [Gulosibacter sp. 10]